MTIGNIPKDIRRKPSRQAYILIGYLHTARPDHIAVAAACRRAVANLYHACMRKILAPLRDSGLNGVKMASGDGIVRRCYPILAIFAGDYPERALVAGIKTGECPTCPVPRDELGNLEELYNPQDLAAVLEALAKADGDANELTRACALAGIKPTYRPFWEDLPFVNIFLSIAPDVLHQLYQRVIKHVVSWIKDAFGPVEIDARCRRLPSNHNTRLFLKGITTLSRVSGTEHGQMCRILLGLSVDLRLPDRQSTTRLIRAVRAALDFLYQAQYPMHSSETLEEINAVFHRFHDNKSIVIDLGICDDFNIPKLHNIFYYPMFIRLWGTLDNCNMETTEGLHIDFAKDAYRATNRKDEYLQMTLWLERKEKILRHDKFVRWHLAGCPPPSTRNSELRPADFVHHRHLQITKFPSQRSVKLATSTARYGAKDFRDAFAYFAVSFKTLSSRNDNSRRLPQTSSFHSNLFPSTIKSNFGNEDPLGREEGGDVLDVVHVKPGYTNKQGRLIDGRFDTIIANDGTGKHSGVKGMCGHCEKVALMSI